MTIKDIAAYCDVSVTTVSRVLNGHPYVNEEVRKRVLEAIESLHYVPNNTARELVKTQPDTIGILARGIGNQFFSQLIPIIENRIHEEGLATYLHQIGSCENELETGAVFARSKKLKGLIFLGGEENYSKEKTAAINVPFVCCSYSNNFGTLSKKRYSSVSVDDCEQGYLATQHLIDNGHRDIAILLERKDDRSISETRYGGYLKALAANGITPDEKNVLETNSFAMADVYCKVDAFLKSGNRPTAIFAVADTMGIAAMKAIHDNGLKIPDDISVIAIDGIETSEFTIPTLTTLVQPKKELGEKAAEVLLRMIAGETKGEQIVLGTTLRKGGSVKKL